MRYNFPIINNKSQVEAVIAGVDDFKIFDRGHYKVANYMFASPETFPPVGVLGQKMIKAAKPYLIVTDPAAIIRRECRGIVFCSKTGKVISRPYHKFFNLNEKEETQESIIDFTAPHVVLEKLDGSMIHPIPRPYAGGLELTFDLATKAGITDVAAQVRESGILTKDYEEFILECINANFTPIFEWCSRKNRVVIDHPVDRLVLTAIRHNEYGYYVPYETMKAMVADYKIELVKAYPSDGKALEFMKKKAAETEGEEGWVIRFLDGHMIKVKADWYVLRHKSKDSLSSEKNVIDMIVNEAVDDVKAFLTEADRNKLDTFTSLFWTGVGEYSKTLTKKIEEIISAGLIPGDRKSFAHAISQSDLNGYEKSLAFRWYDDKDVFPEVIKVIKKNLGTGKRADSIRFMWGNHKWSYHFNDEN